MTLIIYFLKTFQDSFADPEEFKVVEHYFAEVAKEKRAHTL